MNVTRTDGLKALVGRLFSAATGFKIRVFMCNRGFVDILLGIDGEASFIPKEMYHKEKRYNRDPARRDVISRQTVG